MGSNGNATTSTTPHSFCIRDYVRESREQDIRNNWPFDQKYFEVCVKHGIKYMLPPFESLCSMRYSSYRDHDQSRCAQGSNACPLEKELIKVESNMCIEEAILDITKKMSPLSLSTYKQEHEDSDLSYEIPLHFMDMKVNAFTSKSSIKCQTDHCLSAVPSAKSLSKKQKKRKKHKTRSMTEIYAEASHCSLEDLLTSNGPNSATVPKAGMIQFVCDGGTAESKKCVHEIIGSTWMMDHDRRHSPARSLEMKNPRDDNVKKSYALGDKKHISQLRFYGRKSKASK